MAASIQRDRELPGPLPASWAMTSEHCPYLLTGVRGAACCDARVRAFAALARPPLITRELPQPPACERSWAENVGVAYDYFQIGFAGSESACARACVCARPSSHGAARAPGFGEPRRCSFASRAVTLIISCITASVLYQLYVRGPLLPLTVHKKVFILIAVLCTSLVVRSFDPFGWRRWFRCGLSSARVCVRAQARADKRASSFTVTQFFIEVGTSAVYSFVFVVIHDWMVGRVARKCTVSQRR